MTAITIVTDDAATLVREGGVVNRGEPLPGIDEDETPLWRCPYYRKRCGDDDPGMGAYGEGTCTFGCRDEPDCITGGPLPLPFTAEVYQHPGYDVAEVGTVRVVGLHHADDCGTERRASHMSADALAAGAHEEARSLCHPDAEPDKWHMTVEPIGDDDE